jgi:hypothetical protein
MTIEQYITKINTLFQTGNAREHSYRGFAESLMAILPDILQTATYGLVAHLIMCINRKDKIDWIC